MPRGERSLQVSFAGGVLSPEMWSRFDDARVRSGAAILDNMQSRPWGSAARRPGFGLVRQIKDSTYKAKLKEFKFSADQTLVLEMGRADIDSRNIGYFRFHTNGGTLLQPVPDDYRAAVTPGGSPPINTATDEWTVGTHDFQSGDPIVFTMEATTENVSMDFSTNELVTGAAHGFNDGEQALLRNYAGTLPPQFEQGRLYYIINASGSRFQLSEIPGGPAITFTIAGSGTHRVAVVPSYTGGALRCNQTYYAIRSSGTTIKIAATRADAIAGTALDFTGAIGTVDLLDVNIHYQYDNGSVTRYTVTGTDRPFYCFKSPWGTLNSRYINLNDHRDHPPTSTHYWMRQEGNIGTFTVNTGTDRIVWGSHGLSDNDLVMFTSDTTLPAPLNAGQVYYVRNATAGDFQLSESAVSTVLVDIVSAGVGTHTAFGNPIYEVPHYYAEDVLFEVNRAQSADILTLTHLDRPVAELRRRGAVDWVRVDVMFNADVPPPDNVAVSTFGGEGIRIASTSAANPTLVTVTGSQHQLPYPTKVRVEGAVTAGGTVLIPDGHYLTFEPGGSPVNQLHLKSFESGEDTGSAGGTPVSTARIRPSGYTDDANETYVVTAVDDNEEESPASDEVVADNNLLADGAQNTITWGAVAGAIRYRVYKELNGLFGFIGETDAPNVQFIDDNIGPDLSITPPIVDTSLWKVSPLLREDGDQTIGITFDATNDRVEWEGHELQNGAPIIFDNDAAAATGLPTGIDHGVTYFVLNRTDDDFQVATTPTGTTAVVIGGAGSGLHTAYVGAWPSAVTYFEQRRAFGGARLLPQDFWLTASGTEKDLSYSLPTVDSDRIANRLAARERSQIRHAVPAGHLVMLTDAAEYRLTPLDADALTPSSVSARAPTHVGASKVAPVLVNNVVVFPAARGGHVREMGFLDAAGDYVTTDVSLRAAHLFENREIVQMAYHKAPSPIVWAVSDAGTLLGLTYIPEEQVAGWFECSIGGASDVIESCAVVSEGDEDRLYIIANRGGTRYVERMGLQEIIAREDVFYVDSGVSYDGTATTTIYVPHLAGQAVVFLADGVKGAGTVDASTGVLTLATAASKIHVGLSYTSRVRTLPLALQVDNALGTGRTKNITEVFVRVRNSGGFKIGPSLGNALVASDDPAAGELLNELVQISNLGDWNLDGQFWIEQSDPLPLVVTGLTLEMATGG